jgi:hypothetical protein
MAKQMDWEKMFAAAKKAETKTIEKETKSTYDPAKQAEGYKRRIEGAGLDPEKAADNRNVVERLLNLRPDQNIFFDVFEIINRPQQAIFGAIDSAQKGQDVLKGAIQGVTGEKETRFKQVLQNTNLNYKLTDREGKVDLVDVLGFVGDVLLDPVDWAFLPVKGARALVGSLRKTADVLDTIGDADKAAKAAFSFLKSKGKIKFNKVEDLVESMNKLNLTPSNYIRKVADSVRVLQNPLQLAFKGAKGAIGGTLNFADKRLVNFLDYVDNYNLADPRYADYTQEALGKIKLSYKYKGIKSLFRSTFDSIKSLPGRAMEQAYETIGKKQLVNRTGFRLLKDYNDELVDVTIKHAPNLGQDVIDRLAMVATELPYMKQDNLMDFMRRAAKGTQKQRQFIDDESFRRIIQFINVNTPELYKSEFLARLSASGVVGNVKGQFVDPDLMKEVLETLQAFKNSLPSVSDEFATYAGKTKLYKAWATTTDPAKKQLYFEGLQNIQLKKEAKAAAKQFKNKFDFEAMKQRTLMGISELKAQTPQVGRASVLRPGSVLEVGDYALRKALPDYTPKPLESIIGPTSKKQIRAQVKEINKEWAKEIVQSVKANKARVAGNLPSYAVKPPTGFKKYYVVSDEVLTTKMLERGLKANEGKAIQLLKTVPTKGTSEQVVSLFLPETIKLKAVKNGFEFADDIPKEAVQWVDRRIIGTSYESDVAALWKSGKFPTKGALVEHFKNVFPTEGVTLNKKFTDYVANLPDLQAKKIQDLIANDPLKAITQEEFTRLLDSPFDRANYFSDDEIKQVEELLKEGWFKKLVDKGALVRDEVIKTSQQLYGTRFGAEIPEGYARHTITANYKKLNAKELYGDFVRSDLAGNIHAFDGREFAMSAVEANRMRFAQLEDATRRGIYTPEQFERLKNAGIGDMFKTQLSQSLSDFVVMASETTSRTKMLENVIIKSTITDPSLVRSLRAGEKYPSGMVKIRTQDLENKLKGLSRYMNDKTSVEEVLEILKKSESNLAIDQNLYDLIGMLGNDTEMNSFVQLIDGYNNLFKGTKLLTPGFQMKNFLGNLTNILLSGVSVRKFFGESETAYRALAQGDDLLFKAKSKGLKSLTPDEKEIYKYYEGFLASGFQDNSKALYDIDNLPKFLTGVEGKKKNAWQKLLQWNSDANQVVDAQFRMNAYIYASKNPEVFMKLGLDTPEAFVRHVLFDPNDLSHYEKTVIKKLIPFYTFAKKNIVYQMKNVQQRPQAYNQLRKTLDGMWRLADIDPNMDVDTYKRENMWIPIYRYKDGKYIAIKANLPPSELGEFLSNPLQKTLSAASPLLRAPFELVTNRQLFTGLPIQEFKGQKGFNLDFLNRTQEYLVGQTGLDTPIGLAYGTGKGIFDTVTGKTTPTEGFTQGFGRSVASVGDPASRKRALAYDTLNNLKDYQKLLKQQGVTLPTIAEIENKEKQSRNNTLKNQLFKYQKKNMPNYFR